MKTAAGRFITPEVVADGSYISNVLTSGCADGHPIQHAATVLLPRIQNIPSNLVGR
jgi:hypothetical protein